jgi:hypothetical protein
VQRQKDAALATEEILSKRSVVMSRRRLLKGLYWPLRRSFQTRRRNGEVDTPWASSFTGLGSEIQ